MRRLDMWWHWNVLGHRTLTGDQVRLPGEAVTHFHERCVCGKTWNWKAS